MLQFLNDNLTLILGIALIIAIVVAVLNAFLTRRFFREQFKKSIDSLSLPALMDEITTNREKFRTLTGEMLDTLPDRALLEAVYYHLLAQAKEKKQPVERMVFELSGPKRTGSILVVAQESFKMAGFVDTFTYSPALTRTEVTDSYLLIEAKRGAKTVRKATELYLSSKDALTPVVRSQLKSYDDALRWYEKTEKIDTLLAGFVRKNRGAFVEEDA